MHELLYYYIEVKRSVYTLQTGKIKLGQNHDQLTQPLKSTAVHSSGNEKQSAPIHKNCDKLLRFTMLV
jgi:hypothetical protein